jgi:hypothetical protein
MPLTQQLTEQAEREKLEFEATLPPTGSRSGQGAGSVLPYLTRTRECTPTAREEQAAANGSERPGR